MRELITLKDQNYHMLVREHSVWKKYLILEFLFQLLGEKQMLHFIKYGVINIKQHVNQIQSNQTTCQWVFGALIHNL